MLSLQSPIAATTSDDSMASSNITQKPFFHFWRCFWLLFLVASLAYAWYCYYVPANDIVWAENFEAAQTDATQTGKPVLMFLRASGAFHAGS